MGKGTIAGMVVSTLVGVGMAMHGCHALNGKGTVTPLDVTPSGQVRSTVSDRTSLLAEALGYRARTFYEHREGGMAVIWTPTYLSAREQREAGIDSRDLQVPTRYDGPNYQYLPAKVVAHDQVRDGQDAIWRRDEGLGDLVKGPAGDFAAGVALIALAFFFAKQQELQESSVRLEDQVASK